MPEDQHIATSPTATWRIPLEGHQFDLEDFPLWLSGEPVRVERHDGAYFLVLPTDVAGSTYEHVSEVAEHYLGILNGLGRLLGQNFKPLNIGSSFRGFDANGVSTQTVVTVGTVENRSKAGSVRIQIGSTTLPDSRESAASPYLRVAAASKRAQSALQLLGRSHLSWPDLYLLFELVQADIGGAMHTLGWISREQATRFTWTANSFAVLGIDGRHGKDLGSPPSIPMSRLDAEQVIVALITKWLEHLAKK